MGEKQGHEETDFIRRVAEADVTDGAIQTLQLEALYGRGALKKDVRLEISRTLGALKSILKDARAIRSPTGEDSPANEGEG